MRQKRIKVNGKEIIPKFSFNLVEEFDSLIIPNLIGLGILINRAHNGQKIPLSFLRTSPTKFLDTAMFILERKKLLKKNIAIIIA